jgi:hypothetical protein
MGLLCHHVFLHLRKRESEYFLEPLLPYVFRTDIIIHFVTNENQIFLVDAQGVCRERPEKFAEHGVTPTFMQPAANRA